jgi:hypothetical protein
MLEEIKELLESVRFVITHEQCDRCSFFTERQYMTRLRTEVFGPPERICLHCLNDYYLKIDKEREEAYIQATVRHLALKREAIKRFLGEYYNEEEATWSVLKDEQEQVKHQGPYR